MPANNESGRVTMAVLGEQLKRVEALVRETKAENEQGHIELKAILERQETRLRTVEDGKARNETHIGAMLTDIAKITNDVDGLRSKFNIWNGLNSLIAAIAGIIAAILGIQNR